MNKLQYKMLEYPGLTGSTAVWAANGAINWSYTGGRMKFKNMIFDTIATSGIVRIIYPLTATTTIVIDGCHFVTDGGGYINTTLFAGALAPTVIANGNTYRAQSWRYNNVQYGTIADWRAATGQDVASIAY